MAKTNNQKETVIKIDYNGKIPPHSDTLEEIVLGQIMISSDAYADVINLLKDKSVFYVPKHQIIFQAMLEIVKMQAPITLVTVIEELSKTDDLQKVGGPSFITNLSMRVSSAANIEYNAKLLVEKFIQRELIRASAEITDKAYNPECKINDLTDIAEQKILEVTDRSLKKRSIVDIKDAVKEVYDKIALSRNDHREFTGVPCGFRGIDKITLGWQPGSMIVIAARPGVGKTAFSISMINNMVDQKDKEHPEGYKLGMFSLEMSCEQLAMRLLVGRACISQIDLQSGRINDTELEKLYKAKTELERAHIFLDDTPGLSIYEFRSKCRRMKEKHHVDCIIVDYLQLMQAGGQFSREQEVGTISRQIKAVAMELKIPIIALAQLNRGVEGRVGAKDKLPRLSDLRESGSIEQDADMVLFIHREPYEGEDAPKDRDKAIIRIAKNRHGSSGDIELTFVKNYMRFQNVEENPISPNAGDFTKEFKEVVGSKINGSKDSQNTQITIPNMVDDNGFFNNDNSNNNTSSDLFSSEHTHKIDDAPF